MTEASTWQCGRGVPAKGGGWRACGGGYRWQMIGGSGMRIAAVAVAVAVRWFGVGFAFVALNLGLKKYYFFLLLLLGCLFKCLNQGMILLQV